MAIKKKGVLTQGTKVWVLHGEVPTLTRMDCITSIEFGDDSATDIDDTCLEETETKTSQPGLNTPGEGSIKIKTDPDNASHMTLLKLAEEKAAVKIYVGWSDGKEAPTLSGSEVTLPHERTFSTCAASLRVSSPTFEPDSLIEHSIGLKRQSKVTTTFRT